MSDTSFKWRWAHVDQSGRAQQYVDLVNQSRIDDAPAHFPMALAWLNAQPGERLLEVGCGNGAIARAVARYMPSIRELIAVDASEAMVAEAQRQSKGKDLAVQFQVADAEELPFSDASFDRCYTMETLSIVPDPYKAFMELARVTRPGGRICVWESDCDARAQLGSDLDLTRRLMRFVGDLEHNGAVARQVLGWGKGRGWSVQAVPAVGMSEELTSRLAILLHEWIADAQDARVISPGEAEQILLDLQQRQLNGTYFSYAVNFRITAIKS